MNSSKRGDTTSAVEITSVGTHGIWMLRQDEEFFLSYDDFPWFRNQPRQKVLNVQELTPEHLYWPDMDVDLSLASIRDPQKFPLKARV